MVLTEEETLGQTRIRTEIREAPPPSARLASFTELNPGDLVVHVDHGIGRVVSLVNLTVDLVVMLVNPLQRRPGRG